VANARIGARRQITIPEAALQQLGLQPGDVLDVQVRDEGLYLVPHKRLPRDQAWFWSDEWRAKEREASEAIERGELSGPFQTAEGVARHLRGQ
jgi:AbrB family looped-hinge helix DNA binding protein